MGLKVDKKNKVVVAETRYRGKKVKAVVRCYDNDEFDEAFGEKLAIKKMKIKKEISKMNYHISERKKKDKEIIRLAKECNEHTSIIDNLSRKIDKLKMEYENMISEKYKENK